MGIKGGGKFDITVLKETEDNGISTHILDKRKNTFTKTGVRKGKKYIFRRKGNLRNEYLMVSLFSFKMGTRSSAEGGGVAGRT